MSWIIENKEWLFGGAAIAVPIAIIGWIIARSNKKQIQKGGKYSKNIQIGGDLRINNEDSDE